MSWQFNPLYKRLCVMCTDSSLSSANCFFTCIRHFFKRIRALLKVHTERVRRSLVQLFGVLSACPSWAYGFLNSTVTAHILIDTEHSPAGVVDGRTLRSSQTSGSSCSGRAPHSLFSACVLAVTQTSLLCVSWRPRLLHISPQHVVWW